jgi:hypothetical protein
MKIKHYIHEDRFVIEVTPKDREEEKKIREFIEFAELNAEQPKKKNEEKER